MRSVKIQVSVSHPARINIDFSELSSSQTNVMNSQEPAVFCLCCNPDKNQTKTDTRGQLQTTPAWIHAA